ncbi:LacI family DNA-binding transcriptional regulator [Kribbella sandramycini]|uniref:DNA-binding LacI/PurR family transcriptional regulator n=1 Tax=Kribbella sandramycini TaxID=60450 RepID=A0A7Y4P263_9ACTN|nr:LacI family DNA-binding transcriptional regulator [Kribbella sandramycini]MBB6571841.1 DNA-binding LacI/PurR family transcriptional regulator [Kribbella sandramycini]NOL44481.1 LacI family DNA-binding transcriptional regulator [Kribbella sandramycini]
MTASDGDEPNGLRRTHRVTISDLARRLQISKASVSYALNGRAGVSDETRQRVLDLAEELGFHPNSAAVALSASRTRTIGIVIARDPALISTEAFYMRTLVGIEQYLNEVDASLLLRLTGEQGEDLDVLRRWSRQGRVDGFILFDEHDNDPRIPLLKELGIPCVVVSSNAPDDQAGRLISSPTETVTLLLDHLAALGHRDIAHISGPFMFVHERLRVQTLRELAADRGMTVRQLEGSYRYDDGAALTRQLLTGPNPPTAIVLGNDLMAVAALRVAIDLGTPVPGQVSIVAWDDSPLCELAHPGITAVDQKTMERGRAAADLLFRVAAGQDDIHEQAPAGELRARASSGPAAHR